VQHESGIYSMTSGEKLSAVKICTSSVFSMRFKRSTTL